VLKRKTVTGADLVSAETTGVRRVGVRSHDGLYRENDGLSSNSTDYLPCMSEFDRIKG